MDNKPNYENTYWCSKGKYEALDTQLRKLVPESGEVENAESNPALEKYRVASNCYYDLYNNGLCNRADGFSDAFGFSARNQLSDAGGLTQDVIDRTESAMDAIILAAANEQGIETSLPAIPFPPPSGHEIFSVDITPEGCKTPEGAKRVQDAQKDWDDATHALANTVKEFMDEWDWSIIEHFDKLPAMKEDIHQLQGLIGARDRKQEAFLRALAGQ